MATAGLATRTWEAGVAQVVQLMVLLVILARTPQFPTVGLGMHASATLLALELSIRMYEVAQAEHLMAEVLIAQLATDAVKQESLSAAG